ncbi:MAG TPA: hypothetical protein DCY79_20540 [Planctomycetaceae bacterium]|nr:hypothetical protein [Blastopirellula sp.]HAY82201.1 hypothetical protein [Planctomycetaceae bacterium]
MLLNAINAAAGLGSLICFVIVIIHFFQSEQTGLAITCIALLCCGIGGIIAFVKGWMDDLGTVMYVWTVCVLVSLLTNFAIALTGPGPMAN